MILLPCPFCGSQKVELRLYNQPSVVCENCLAMGPAAPRLTKWPNNLDECKRIAQEKWNQRTLSEIHRLSTSLGS